MEMPCKTCRSTHPCTHTRFSFHTHKQVCVPPLQRLYPEGGSRAYTSTPLFAPVFGKILFFPHGLDKTSTLMSILIFSLPQTPPQAQRVKVRGTVMKKREEKVKKKTEEAAEEPRPARKEALAWSTGSAGQSTAPPPPPPPPRQQPPRPRPPHAAAGAGQRPAGWLTCWPSMFTFPPPTTTATTITTTTTVKVGDLAQCWHNSLTFGLGVAHGVLQGK